MGKFRFGRRSLGVLGQHLAAIFTRAGGFLVESFAEPVIFFAQPGLHGSASRYGQSCEGWSTRRDSVRKSGSAYAVFVPLCIKFTPQAPGTWCFRRRVSPPVLWVVSWVPFRRTQFPALDYFVINGRSDNRSPSALLVR